MILAAGLGTRLGARTRDTPKALIPVAGVPMLERVARRLIEAGADRLIINTHHHPEQISDFVAARDGFGVPVAFSPEPDRPLETGGGLLQARALLDGDEPFFLHNVDILTNLPLAALYETHLEAAPLATLAVMERKTSRYLLFDDSGLFGRVDEKKGLELRSREPHGEVYPLAFGGVHVISSEIFPLLTETGAFSILDPYLRLASAGYRILPFRVDDYAWMDIGKPEQLEEAERMLGA
jgi:NDP-sugar pyrophosphorylase family protein